MATHWNPAALTSVMGGSTGEIRVQLRDNCDFLGRRGPPLGVITFNIDIGAPLMPMELNFQPCAICWAQGSPVTELILSHNEKGQLETKPRLATQYLGDGTPVCEEHWFWCGDWAQDAP